MQPIYLVESYAAEEFNLQAEMLSAIKEALVQLPVPEHIKKKLHDINNELTARKAARDHRMGVEKSPWPYGIKGLVDWFESARRIPSKEIQASIVASHLCQVSTSRPSFAEDYRHLFAYHFVQDTLTETFLDVVKSDILKVGEQLNEKFSLNVTWMAEVTQKDDITADIVFQPKELGPLSFVYDPSTLNFKVTDANLEAETGKTRLEAVIALVRRKGFVKPL